MDLPFETVCKILSYVDGATLVRSQTVSKLWQRASCELDHDVHWERLCRMAIVPEFLVNLIYKLYPGHLTNKNTSVAWKVVYICWYRWRHLKHWPARVIPVNVTKKGKFTCAKFCGSWVVYGTIQQNNRGALQSFDFDWYGFRDLYSGMEVLDFMYIVSEDQTCHYDDEDYKAEDDISKFTENGLDVCTDQRYTFKLDLNCSQRTIKDYGTPNSDTMKWLYTVHSIMGEQLRVVDDRYKGSDYAEPMDLVKVRLFLEENERVEEIKDSDSLKSTSDYGFHGGELHVKNWTPFLKNTFDFGALEGVLYLHNWIQLHHNVAMGTFIKDFHVVVFMVGTEYKLCCPSRNLGHVTTALLHSGNLFVTTWNGFLYRYKIEKIEDLLAFDFSAYDWSVSVHEPRAELIQSIDVSERYAKPCIILSTLNRLILIDFRRSSELDSIL